ncbi:DUF397 domain-containing protein [Kitasatospora sp. NPDC004240]
MSHHPEALSVKLAYHKSSYSGGDENCVEISAVPHNPLAYIRDSKDPDGPALAFTTAAHTAFITAVAQGEFDFGLLEGSA